MSVDTAAVSGAMEDLGLAPLNSGEVSCDGLVGLQLVELDKIQPEQMLAGGAASENSGAFSTRTPAMVILSLRGRMVVAERKSGRRTRKHGRSAVLCVFWHPTDGDDSFE